MNYKKITSVYLQSLALKIHVGEKDVGKNISNID